jgi:hypothetical protein
VTIVALTVALGARCAVAERSLPGGYQAGVKKNPADHNG